MKRFLYRVCKPVPLLGFSTFIIRTTHIAIRADPASETCYLATMLSTIRSLRP